MRAQYTENLKKRETVEEWLAIICCIAMIAGMFFSRVLLSFSMLLLFLIALQPQHIAGNWRRWRKSPFAVFSLLFFLVYLLSGLWSQNTQFWLASATNKLPFVALPFAFLAVPLHKERYQRVVIISIMLLQLGIIANSLLQLQLHREFYLSGYEISQPLPTTKYGDHIRFSLSLVMTILMSFYLLFEKQKTTISRGLKLFLSLGVVVFVIYIHILAAKTGIMCLYLLAIVYAVVRVGRSNKLLALAVPVAIICLPVVAYQILPTFRTKINYVSFEISKSKQDNRYDYTLSDAGRMITYDIGSKAIAAHPWSGVGAGDLMDEMRLGYRKYYPEVSSDQQYGPINQFMFTALSIGIPLTLLLVGMVISPFIASGNRRLYLIITAFIMLVSMLVESMLELQFGVFVFLFFILFWMSALRKVEPTGY